MPKTSAVRQAVPEHAQSHPSDRAIATANDRAAAAARSTTTVRIGCKLPLGLIMELADPGVLVDKDGRVVQGLRPNPRGQRVILKGANSLRTDRRAAQGIYPFAVTIVDKVFWEAWYARHKDEEYVRKGFVFLAADDASEARANENAAAAVKDKGNLPTGMEPLALEKDPRMKPTRNPVTTVEVDPASRPENRDADPSVVAV